MASFFFRDRQQKMKLQLRPFKQSNLFSKAKAVFSHAIIYGFFSRRWQKALLCCARRRISYRDEVQRGLGRFLAINLGTLSRRQNEKSHKTLSLSFVRRMQQASKRTRLAGHAEVGNHSVIDELNAPFRFSFDKSLLLHILEIVKSLVSQ